MKMKNLFIDPLYEDKHYQADQSFVSMNSHGSKIFGVMYTAQGIAKHPTMILLHGFPGTERNFDLAHAFRRAGWNTFVFHYRGSWGSHGVFSFHNVLEDVKVALEFIRSKDSIEKYHIDIDNIALFGHSMGGFASLMTACEDINIKACIAVAPYNLGEVGNLIKKDNDQMDIAKNMFEECIVPLNVANVDILFDEMITNNKIWNLNDKVSQFSENNVLLIAGSRDADATPEIHYQPLVEAFSLNKKANFENYLIDSGHSFQDKRIELTEIIGDWLERKLP
jgi:pimeloyl-ACP methyl ester carboxylesterase